MQKTLGGDRLGAGNKLKVNLHGYERSTHDLGYLWRSTMSAGTLVPFMTEIALPGDTFDINLNADIKTHPTIGPLFGSYKVQLDVFQAPIRLYNSLLHNNALKIGMNMAQVKFPVLVLNATGITAVDDIDNSQINPSCILHYLGIKGVGKTTESGNPRNFNAIPYLAYWEIYKNYYANKQEEIGAVIHTPSTVLVNTVTGIDIRDTGGTDTDLPEAPLTNPQFLLTDYIFIITYTGTQPQMDQIMIQTEYNGIQSIEALTNGNWSVVTAGVIQGIYDANIWGSIRISQWRYQTNTDSSTRPIEVATFDLENIDRMREALLAFNSKTTPYETTALNLPPYSWIQEEASDIPNMLHSQEGLGIKTYQSDLFNNWLQTEWIDGTGGINEITAISTVGDSFQINTLILARKVYDMLNRIAVSGGTYEDWQEVTYDHEIYRRCESPIYCGGLIKELVFQEVVSNSQDENQPLGTLAGKGVLSKKHKGGKVIIKVDEPSYIIGIISLTPRIDYSQGNKWDVNLKTMDDLHKPGLDEIGFQELITEQMAWWTTVWDDTNSVWIQKSAGKQPAWLNYMTNVNQTHGNFAIKTNEMFMTLNRRYEWNLQEDADSDILDLTTYIDPSKYNQIFAQTQLDAQNFWAQIAVDITARRKMSAKLMPNL